MRLAAEAAGLTTAGVVDQMYFLLALAARLSPPLDAPRDRLALKTLAMPGGLGSTHKVLVFSKGTGHVPLTGLEGGRLT